MVVTWFFILLLSCVAVTFYLFPSAWLAGVIGLGGIGLLWGWDFWQTKGLGPSGRRRAEGPAYQNRPFSILVEVHNPFGWPLQLEVKDEPPFAVKTLSSPRVRLTIAPGEWGRFSYEILPPRRGLFEFGRINLRYAGRWRLYCRQISLTGRQQLKVYPDLSTIDADRLAVAAGSGLAGRQALRGVGIGGQLTQLREFNPGDDYRKINWKVTAHTGKFILNQFQPEQDQSVYVLLDAGRMLYDQLSPVQSRFDYILDSAVLLAYNIVNQGDLVGAMSFGERVERFIPPGKGIGHLRRIIAELFDREARMVESDYREAFRLLQSKLNKRSLLFVYTDFTDAESSKALLGYLKVLARNHLVVCVVLVQDYLIDSIHQPIFREKDAYLKATAFALLREREKLKQILTGFGIKILEVSRDGVKKTVAQHYLLLKRKGLF